MKKVDQRVTATAAKIYVQSMITEHSLSPAPNNWAMVPEKLKWEQNWVYYEYQD